MRNTFNFERHNEPRTMVIEALDEYIYSIGEMLKYRKLDSELWSNPNGGTLGYPCAILLFVIVDTIGSYFRKSTKLIEVDGKKRKISSAGYQHFFILNSEFFGLSLSEKEIKTFYEMGRNKLLHNSLIGAEVTLVALNSLPFLESNQASGKGKYVVYLNSFYNACILAIYQFKQQQNEIFQNSSIGKALPIQP